MKRANYDNRPAIFEAVGNGSYIYRWDIQEEKTPAEGSEKERVSYTCLEVIVWGVVTRAKVKSACINAMWGDGVEEKLINDYNAAVLKVLDTSYKEAYKNFLTERKALKEQVEADLIPLGIPAE